MKKAIISLAATLLATASFGALANSDLNLTVQSVGTQSGIGYLHFHEALSASCTYNVVYIGSLDEAGPKSIYAAALSALATGGKVVTLAYYQNSDGTCTGTQFEVSR